MGDTNTIGVSHVSDVVDGSHLRRQYRLPFPDEEHSCEPRRRVKFAKLPCNALPASPVPFKKANLLSPSKRNPNNARNDTANRPGEPKSSSPTTSLAVQSIRRSRLGVKNEKNKMEDVAAKYLPRRSALEQWVSAHTHSPPRGRQAIGSEICFPTDNTSLNQEVRAADYDLYLYLASKFGPLDGVLFCCSPLPGRTYRRLTNSMARTLQRWLRQRMKALRQYWIARLAHATTSFVIEFAVEAVALSYHLEERALGFLDQLRCRRAVRLLYQWQAYSKKLQEVRMRHAHVLEQSLRARFIQWRERVMVLKNFKRQLKIIARRKAMANAMEQWQQWKIRHFKLRCHLTKRWVKMQYECWMAWSRFIQESRAARRIQKLWRLALWRWKRSRAGMTISVCAKGFLARKHVNALRVQIEVGRVTMGLVEQLVWASYHHQLTGERARALETEIARGRRERDTVEEADKREEARVNSELSAVVRNAMHQRLQERMRALKEGSEGNRSSWKLLKNHALLRQIAAQEIVEQQRVAVKEAAIAKFRAESELNLPSEICLVCGLEISGDHPLAEWWSDVHNCIPVHMAASNPDQGWELLEHLDRAEQLRVQSMVRVGWIQLLPHHVRRFIDPHRS